MITIPLKDGKDFEPPITKVELATELRLPLFTASKSIARLLALLRAEGLVSSDER
jgi:hypothetical protein